MLGQSNVEGTATALQSAGPSSAFVLDAARSLGVSLDWAPCANNSDDANLANPNLNLHTPLTTALLRAGAVVHSTANTSTWAERMRACRGALRTMMGKPSRFSLHGNTRYTYSHNPNVDP